MIISVLSRAVYYFNWFLCLEYLRFCSFCLPYMTPNFIYVAHGCFNKNDTVLFKDTEGTRIAKIYLLNKFVVLESTVLH